MSSVGVSASTSQRGPGSLPARVVTGKMKRDGPSGGPKQNAGSLPGVLVELSLCPQLTQKLVLILHVRAVLVIGPDGIERRLPGLQFARNRQDTQSERYRNF